MNCKIVITTGGSGGHIFPAQAIAKALLDKGCEVIFITDKRGKEFQGLNVPTYRLMAEHVMGRRLFGKIKGAFKLLGGAMQALILLKKLKPDMVIGVGGYASIPAVMAAHLWRTPVILHEQNAVLGRANRMLSKGVRMICTSFNPTQRMPKGIPTIFTGMMARPNIVAVENTPYPKIEKEFRLLIFGGSQGTRFFSRHLPAVLLSLPPVLRKKIVLTQQVRPEDMDFVQKAYAKADFKSVTLASFFDNMPQLLTESHLIIGRAGASTLTELMVVGRPALLFPLLSAADNHQMENALQFCNGGGGWVLSEAQVTDKQILAFIQDLMENPKKLATAAQKAHEQAKPRAAETVANIVLDLIKCNSKSARYHNKFNK